jgi:hypothetical protein
MARFFPPSCVKRNIMIEKNSLNANDSNSDKIVTIVGSGISGLIQAFYWAQKPMIKIHLLIADHDLFPCASARSGIVNSIRGIEKGVSPLGDLLVESWQEFVAFLHYCHKRYPDAEFLDYLFEASEDYIIDDLHPQFENLKQRFQSQNAQCAYYIEGEKFLQAFIIFLQREFKSKVFLIYDELLSLNFENQVWSIVLRKMPQNILQSETVILCVGKDFYPFVQLIHDEKLQKKILQQQLVAGSSWIKHQRVFDKSRPVKIVTLKLIENNSQLELKMISSSEKIFYLGTTTDQNHLLTPSKKMEELFSKAFELYPFIDEKHNHEGHIYTGIRVKGKKRMPHWSEVAPGLFLVTGLYKNGYLFSFLAAKELAHYSFRINTIEG